MKMLARFFANSTHFRKSARPRVVFGLMSIVALFAAFPLVVAAQGAPAALFTGMGFIDDHSVEDGIVVEAWVRGKPVAATEIYNQGFILYVAEPPGESFEGEDVRFKFRGLETDAVAEWVEGTEHWVLLYAYTGLQGDPDGFGGDPEDPKNPASPDAPHPDGPPSGEEEPDPGAPLPKESKRNRGFFTNSMSTDTNGLDDALDPTALAVIGILITLVASAIQLFKGN